MDERTEPHTLDQTVDDQPPTGAGTLRGDHDPTFPQNNTVVITSVFPDLADLAEVRTSHFAAA